MSYDTDVPNNPVMASLTEIPITTPLENAGAKPQTTIDHIINIIGKKLDGAMQAIKDISPVSIFSFGNGTFDRGIREGQAVTSDITSPVTGFSESENFSATGEALGKNLDLMKVQDAISKFPPHVHVMDVPETRIESFASSALTTPAASSHHQQQDTGRGVYS